MSINEEATNEVICRIYTRRGEMKKIEKTYINKESEAYNTGYEAAKQGEPRSANPYRDETLESDWWLAGWDDASE